MHWFVLGVMERANKTGLGDVAGVSSINEDEERTGTGMCSRKDADVSMISRCPACSPR